VKYADGERRYIIAPKGVKPGDEMRSGATRRSRPATAMPLRNIPVGSTVHNVEMKPGKGGSSRAAPAARCSSRARRHLRLHPPASGETRKVHVDCRATIGEVGNDEHNLRKYGKAGAKRWRGIRPTVRGVGDEPGRPPARRRRGQAGQGNPHPVSPWGWPTKGKKTRTNKRTSNMIVQRRHRAQPLEVQELGAMCLVRSRKVPFVDLHLAKKVQTAAAKNDRADQDLVAPLDDRAPRWSASRSPSTTASSTCRC
jgi:large subunit ribosomal protein L2